MRLARQPLEIESSRELLRVDFGRRAFEAAPARDETDDALRRDPARAVRRDARVAVPLGEPAAVAPEDERHVPPYQVPYRALIPRGAQNLLVAGRCFSADQLALSSARVMTTASMMGQAAGIAAAWSAAGKRPVGEVTAATLRRELANRRAVLEPAPGMTPVAPPRMGDAVDAAPAGSGRH